MDDEVRMRVSAALRACCEDALPIVEGRMVDGASAATYRQRFTAFYCAIHAGSGTGTPELLESAITQAEENARMPVVADEEDTTAGTSSVACRCGSRNVTDRTVQARSADEAPDVFYVCKSCGRTWRS